MSDADADNTGQSKAMIILIVAVILAGTGLWYFLTVTASAPISPGTSKHLAEVFERECFLDLQDKEQCRKLIGQHHRACLLANTHSASDGPSSGGSPTPGSTRQHDRGGYLSCMRQATGVSYEHVGSQHGGSPSP